MTSLTYNCFYLRLKNKKNVNTRTGTACDQSDRVICLELPDELTYFTQQGVIAIHPYDVEIVSLGSGIKILNKYSFLCLGQLPLA